MKRVTLTLLSAFTLGIFLTIGTPRVEIILQDSLASFSKTGKKAPARLVEKPREIPARRLKEFISSTGVSIRLPGDITNEELKQFSASQFSAVKEVYFQNCSINESGLKHLRNLPVEKLFLSGCSISDREADEIAALKDLKILSLNETWVGDETLAHLTGLPLEKLYLNNTFISDKGVQNLKGLPLKKLYLEGTDITNKGIFSISKLSLTALNVSNTDIDGDSLPAIGQITSLQKLYIRETAVLIDQLSSLPDSLELSF